MLNCGLGMMESVLPGVAPSNPYPYPLNPHGREIIASNRVGSLRSLRGLGALQEYPMSVGVLQTNLNMERLVAKQDVAAGVTTGPTARFARSSPLVQDSKYGRMTNGALKMWVDWKVDRGDVSGISSSDVKYAGPEAAADMLTTFLMLGPAQVGELQEAWRAWRSAGQPASRPGDVDQHQQFLNQTAPKKGMPLWGWFLIGAGVVGGGVAAYYYFKD